jgi:histidinol-phosphate aminotransferase
MAKSKQPRPRKALDKLHAYVPGEQPQGGKFVKLNTNENPYPPPPSVSRALSGIKPEDFPRYPDPECRAIREHLAKQFKVKVENIIVGNGSDEILRYICNVYINKGDRCAQLEPTYSLYEVLVAIFEGETVRFKIRDDGKLPDTFLRSAAKIAFLPNPNPPIGETYSESEVRRLIEHNPARLIVLDEAYVDFAPRHLAKLAKAYPNVIVTRTFSKSCMMAGARIGYAIGHKEVLEPLYKIKDSYNVNLFTQVAGLAALKVEKYMERCNARVVRDREWLRTQLERRGFMVTLSGGNFVFARISIAKEIYLALKARNVFVRWFDKPGLTDGLRITIGTRDDLKTLLAELDKIL